VRWQQGFEFHLLTKADKYWGLLSSLFGAAGFDEA
jgi:hypothetical protein